MKQYEEVESLLDFLNADKERVRRERSAAFFRTLNQARAEAREAKRKQEIREAARIEEQRREERRRKEAWERATASPPATPLPQPSQPNQERAMTPSEWCSKQFFDWCFQRGEFAPEDEIDPRLLRSRRLYGMKK